MYRHQAIEIAAIKRYQTIGTPIEETLPAWAADAILHGYQLGLAQGKATQNLLAADCRGQALRVYEPAKSHPECRRCMQDCGLLPTR